MVFSKESKRWALSILILLLSVGGSTQILRVHQYLKDVLIGKVSSNSMEGEKVVISLGVARVSLGIEIVGGVMNKIIPAYTLTPTKKSVVVTTYHDNQTMLTIKVYLGERTMVKDCIELGSFDLTGIAPAPKGVPQIKPMFYVELNEMLHVTAKDKSTENSQSITIKRYTGNLSEEEIQKLFEEAKENAVADNMIKEKIISRNILETYVFSMKNAVNDNKNVESDDKEKIEKALKEAIEWLDNNLDAEKYELDEKMKVLKDICTPIIGEIYNRNEGEKYSDDLEEDGLVWSDIFPDKDYREQFLLGFP